MPPRQETIRQGLLRILRAHKASALDLSAELGIPEKAVYAHLEHLRRSLQHAPETLAIDPATCLDCGFRFGKRTRLTRPGKCPACRGTHLSAPLFYLL